jgi:hypothetical protein
MPCFGRSETYWLRTPKEESMINSDLFLERLRERVQEPVDEYDRGYCASCDGTLTSTDTEAGECTACGATLVDDESAEEHLHEDYDEFDWYNSNGPLDAN